MRKLENKPGPTDRTIHQGEGVMNEFLNIDELSQHLAIKKSSLYSMVEKGEIPYYRFGRLVRFKKTQIDAWAEGRRKECIDIAKEARKVLKVAARPGRDINRVVKKSIEEVKGFEYTASQGKPDQVKGPRKEGNNGAL